MQRVLRYPLCPKDTPRSVFRFVYCQGNSLISGTMAGFSFCAFPGISVLATKSQLKMDLFQLYAIFMFGNDSYCSGVNVFRYVGRDDMRRLLDGLFPHVDKHRMKWQQ